MKQEILKEVRSLFKGNAVVTHKEIDALICETHEPRAPDFRNKTKCGLTVVSSNPLYAVNLNRGTAFYGWLFCKGPEHGQWVSSRELSDLEIITAEDQELYGIIEN
jgi:hypothetical protein